MTLRVAANSFSPLVHTIDEQGLCHRTLAELIAHAANRYACEHGARMFLNVLIRKA